MTCNHDKKYGLFGLPKETNGCLACAYEHARKEVTMLNHTVTYLSKIIKKQDMDIDAYKHHFNKIQEVVDGINFAIINESEIEGR